MFGGVSGEWEPGQSTGTKSSDEKGQTPERIFAWLVPLVMASKILGHDRLIPIP